MPTIHIARNQQTLGSFSEEEVREGLRSGRFSSEDLTWQVGMETWKPLGEMAPLWGLNATPPPLDKGELEVATVVDPVVNEGNEPAWEERESIGFFPAISQTVSAVLMRPTETFAEMKHDGGLTNPLLYFVLMSCAAYTISVLYQITTLSMEPGALPEALGHFPKNMVNFIMVGTVLISPAIYVVSAFVSAGITHLSLKLLGGANRPFETSFRVICYAQASAAVFYLLPLFGGLMAILWGSYTIIIGLMKAHGISGWKATLAITLPGLLCCGAFLAIGAAAGISIAELGKH